MKKEQTIVCGTTNKHKIKEMQDILSKHGIKLISRDDAGVPPVEITEDGDTFEENSYKKAYEIMKLCNLPTMADDSGLMVDYLGGAPGVYSARFAGEEGNYEKNNEKLLRLLENVEKSKRTAKFVTVITLVFPDGEKIVARGECKGRIISEPCGENGFGYDPIFLPEGKEKTFAQMSAEEKNSISHRAKALKELERLLVERDF